MSVNSNKSSLLPQSIRVHILGQEAMVKEKEDPMAAGHTGGGAAGHWPGGGAGCSRHDYR